MMTGIQKGKVLQYSLPSVGPRADPGVQAISHSAVGSHYFLPSLHFTLVSVRQMASPLTEVKHPIAAYYSSIDSEGMKG